MSTLKLLFCGDVCFKVQQEVDLDRTRKILAEMLPFFDAVDYRVMNLETPLAPEGIGAPIPKSGPNIIGRPKNIGFLEAAGCDLAVLANNHTGDYGDDALNYTLGLLKEHNISYVGAGANIDEAYSAVRIVKNGVSLSIIGVCENEFGIADTDKAGAAGFDLERLGDKLREEKSVSDRVIVVFHGGCEHNPLPSPLCRERYRTIIRLGADALIGGHTHCIQGYEYYDGKPIIYSMGNFLFKWDNPASDAWRHGYMTELTIEDDKLSVRPIPYCFEADGSAIHPLTGARLHNMLAYIERLSLIINDADELTRLYKGWCTISGLSYIRSLSAKPEYFDLAKQPADIPALKNLLSCEAHNELIRTTLNLAFFGELADAFEWAEELRELQKLPE